MYLNNNNTNKYIILLKIHNEQGQVMLSVILLIKMYLNLHVLTRYKFNPFPNGTQLD